MTNTDRQDIKLAGATGVVSIALAAVAALIAPMWDLPPTDASPAQIRDFFADDRTGFFVTMVVNTAVVSLWLVFGAGVWLRLRRAARGQGTLLAEFALGFVSLVTLLLAGFTAAFVLGYRAPDVTEARLLYDLTFGLLAMSGMPTAVALVAYAGLIFRTDTLPRSTAWIALVAAVAHVILLASFIVETGFFSLQGEVIMAIPATLFLWIAATGVALWRAEPLPTEP
jgi:hypothetical protein